jgi:RNA polymerase sigma-70 factor, ECF subfamily
MDSASSSQVTVLLARWANGDQQALKCLMPLVYEELRRLARFHLRNEPSNVSVQASDLVHETYLRLIQQHSVDWQHRGQFYSFAAQLMRRILVDHARKQCAGKRGGSKIKVALEDAVDAAPRPARSLEILALDMALDNLAKLDRQQAEIVELRFFGGRSIEETAEVLGVSPATIKREWTLARAWLYRAIRKKAETV